MMSLPSTSIVPELGSIRRLIIRMVVVLPHPDGPTRMTVSPSPTSSEKLSTAAVAAPGKRLVTFRSEIIAVTDMPSLLGSDSSILLGRFRIRSSGGFGSGRRSVRGLRLEGLEGIPAGAAEVRGAAERRAERALENRVIAL